MDLFWGGLVCLSFEKATMLSGCIAAEINLIGMTANPSPLPGRSGWSSVHGIELSVLAQWALFGSLAFD